MTHEKRMSETTTWLTPRWLFDWLGSFDLDPATIDNHPWPCAKENRSSGGLDTPWHGRVFLNPPFSTGQIEPFVRRMAEHGLGVMVCAARVETAWFQDHVFGEASAIWFPRGRIQFCRPDGVVAPRSGFPSCVVFYGEQGSPAPRAGHWWHP